MFIVICILFIADKIASGHFKDEIMPSIKENDGFKLSQDVASNHVREKVKQRCKLPYTLLKEEDGYDFLIDISPYPTLIQLKLFLAGSNIVLQLLISGF